MDMDQIRASFAKLLAGMTTSQIDEVKTLVDKEIAKARGIRAPVSVRTPEAGSPKKASEQGIRGVEGSASREVMDLAHKKMSEASGKLSMGDALSLVFRERPDLYAKYEAEGTVHIHARIA